MDEQLSRRAFILDPGESLLLSRSNLETALRFGLWGRFTGLPKHAIISNPIVATPLVEYPAEGHPARVWPQLNPASLWHPLLWLPERLAGRYQLIGEDGQTVQEDDDTWAVRVCLELSASGMYDVESGTWLDVLARYGLDVDDPATLDRIRLWQAGAADPVLDSIDLSTDIDVEDRHWAVETAMALMDDLRPASWALLANDMLVTIDEIADPDNPSVAVDPTATHQAAATMITLGKTLLADPGIGLHEHFWAEQELALQLIRADDFEAVLDGPIAAISTALYEVRDAHWPHLDALEEAGREPEPVPA